MADGDGNPLNARGGIGDHITGLAALSGVLAAVLEQRHTGRGRVVEVSLLRTGAYVLGWDLGIQMALGRVAGAEPRHRNQAPLMNPYRAGRRPLVLLHRASRPPATSRPCAGPSAAPTCSTTPASPTPRRSGSTAPRSSPSSTRSSPSARSPSGPSGSRPRACGGRRPRRRPRSCRTRSWPPTTASSSSPAARLRSVNGPVTFSGVRAPQGAHVPGLGEHTDEVLAELADPASDTAGAGPAPLSCGPSSNRGGPVGDQTWQDPGR